jgi:tetratricopeptide (TPR) repeat protein
MRPLCKKWLWLVVLGLAPQAGCVSLNEGMLSSQADSSSMTTLPGGEAERLCLKVADQLETAGHFREAAAELERARQRNPKLDVTHRLGLLYERAGDYARALAEYKKEMDALHTDANSVSHYMFGWLTENKGGVRLTTANLCNDVGYCLYLKGDWAESEKYLRLALDANPKHPTAWSNLGLTLAAQGNLNESMEAFMHNVTMADAYCNIAVVQFEQGKLAEAKETFRQALEQDPNNEKADRGLKQLEKREPAPPAPPTDG